MGSVLTEVKLELEELKPRMLGVGLDSTEETPGTLHEAFAELRMPVRNE